MFKSKYIIFEFMGSEYPVLFPSWIDHCRMVGDRTVASAGMFEVGAEPTEKDNKDISVWAGGKSVTLKIDSRPQDAAMIKRMLRHEYTF